MAARAWNVAAKAIVLYNILHQYECGSKRLPSTSKMRSRGYFGPTQMVGSGDYLNCVREVLIPYLKRQAGPTSKKTVGIRTEGSSFPGRALARAIPGPSVRSAKSSVPHCSGTFAKGTFEKPAPPLGYVDRQRAPPASAHWTNRKQPRHGRSVT